MSSDNPVTDSGAGVIELKYHITCACTSSLRVVGLYIMNTATAPERVPDPELSRGVETLFRPAVGPQLQAMFGELALLTAHPGIILPADPEGRISPRLILAQSSELRANRKSLEPIDIKDPYFVSNLAERLPGLTKSTKAVFSSIDLRKSKTSDHYLSLYVGRNDKEKLAEERNAIWHMLGVMAHTKKLDWQQYIPDIEVAMMRRARVPESAAQHIAAYVQKQLPLRVTLGPIYDPAKR
jgi:hypothetical protein